MNHCPENAPIEDSSESFDDLVQREAELRVSALQHVTDVYRQALYGPDPNSYLQGFSVQPVPDSLGFKMDSKKPFFNDGDNSLEPYHLRLYVPAEEAGTEWVQKFWAQYEQHGSKSPLYYVDADQYELVSNTNDPTEEIPRLDLEYVEVEQASIDKLIEHEVLGRKAAIQGLSRLITAIRDDYELVPFRQ